MIAPTWFLKPGFRVRPTKRPKFGHVQGGANSHKGATCGICRIPLLLIWTIDRSDPRFLEVPPTRVNDSAAALARFRKVRYLKLYYCWRCVADISYTLISKTKIEIVHQQGECYGEGFPYKGFPEAFPEIPLELEAIPSAIESSIQMAQCEHGWMSAKEESRLRSWFGSDDSFEFGTPPTLQLGGLPILAQGREYLNCKRKTCRFYSAEDRDYSQPDFLRVLAVVHDTPDLPMFDEDGGNPYSQVIFMICRACHSIRAINRCD